MHASYHWQWHCGPLLQMRRREFRAQSLLLTPLVRLDRCQSLGFVPLPIGLAQCTVSSQALRRLQVGGHTEAWHSNHTKSDSARSTILCVLR